MSPWQSQNSLKEYLSSTFKTIAFVLMGFPLIYIVLLATAFNVPIAGCMRILLSPGYYLVTGLSVIAGFGLSEMRRWSWYVFLLSQVLVIYEDAWVASEYAESHHKVFIFFASLLFQGIIIYRVAREIRVPYFFPKIRWWESNPRYKLSIPVSIARSNGEAIRGEILDLAGSGCFVKLRDSFPIGERVDLSFSVFDLSFKIEGTVVWEAMSTVTHPKGLGVIFDDLSRDQKRSLRAVSVRLKKVAKHYRKHRYWMEQAQFDQVLQQIESVPMDRRKLRSSSSVRGERMKLFSAFRKGQND